jgi:hypothetical protein
LPNSLQLFAPAGNNCNTFAGWAHEARQDGPVDRNDPPPVSSSDDVMALTRIRSACAGLPEVEEAELQGRPLFRVRRRRFAIFNGAASPARPRWQRFGRSLHVLTDPTELAALRQDPRFEVSPHHGVLGWMALALHPSTTDWAEVAELLEAAYRQAAPRSLGETLDLRRER